MPEKIRLDQFDLTDEEILGLDESVVEQLLDKYEFISDVINESVLKLTQLEGVGRKTALDIKNGLTQIQKEVESSESLKKPSEEESSISGPLIDRELTKEEEIAFEESLKKEEKEEDTREYVLVETQVDKFFTHRTRIEVGPATCRECGYDVIKVNKLPEWEQLSSIDQNRVKRTLEKHMENYHSSPSGHRILTSKQLKDTNWTKPVHIKP